MVAKEYCCYTRPYSSIEGFQLAHTLYYSASVEEEGVVPVSYTHLTLPTILLV